MIGGIRLSVGPGPGLYDIDAPMKRLPHTIFASAALLLAACAEEPPPVSVDGFMENRRLLEATMVRCAENRSEMKYVVECVNAREAINRIEAVEDKIRQQEFEKQSTRKRQALRRTQEAAAAARRRALEEQRRREEEAYLGLFEQPPPDAAQQPAVQDTVVESTPNPAAGDAPAADLDLPAQTVEDQRPAAESSQPVGTDLDAIREELRRRQQTPNN